MPKIIHPPEKCRYCGGRVELVTGEFLYGSIKYANKNFYLCIQCGAYVSCHDNTKKPLGILANDEERTLRKKCHALFDNLWRQDLKRKDRYSYLAGRMGIKWYNCHIAYFDKKRVLKAIKIMTDDLEKAKTVKYNPLGTPKT